MFSKGQSQYTCKINTVITSCSSDLHTCSYLCGEGGRTKEVDEDLASLTLLLFLTLDEWEDMLQDMDFPAYSDTGYSDTPITVTVLTVPNWPFIHQN